MFHIINEIPFDPYKGDKILNYSTFNHDHSEKSPENTKQFKVVMTPKKGEVVDRLIAAGANDTFLNSKFVRGGEVVITDTNRLRLQ